MRLFILIGLHLSLSALAVTKTPPSTAIMGPGTMNAPQYPESGDHYRTDDVTGTGMSTATFESSNRTPALDEATTIEPKPQEKDLNFKIGPYDRKGEYNYLQGLVR